MVTTPTPAPTPTPAAPGRAVRAVFLVNAVVAWAGVALQLVLAAGGFYPSTQQVLSQLGPGSTGPLARVVDALSYFTIWSNIVVAVVLTLLLRPSRHHTATLRVLRLDSLLMITITGLVYAVVLAPSSTLVGWQVLGNLLVHQLTPVLTILVWLVLGPRGWISWSTIPPAFLLPAVWVAYTLVRGAVIGAYPYPFIDVVQHGYGTVAVNLVAIVLLGIVISAILLAVDRLLSRRQR